VEDCKYHTDHESRITYNSNRLDKHEDWIKRIENRPPVWATFVMMGTGTLVGALLTFLGIIVRNGSM